MPNRRETTITNELVNILRNMRYGWELETEVNASIRKLYYFFDRKALYRCAFND